VPPGDDEDLGFVEDAPAGAADDLGFVEDEPAAAHAADPVIHTDPGFSAPDPAPQQSARRITAPVQDFRVDPRGRRPGTFTERGDYTLEIAEDEFAAPVAPPPQQAPAQPAPSSAWDRFMRAARTQGPHVAVGQAAMQTDPGALLGGILSGVESGSEDERAGSAAALASPLARIARMVTPEPARAGARAMGLDSLARSLPGGGAMQTGGDAYRSARDEVREGQRQRRERAPVSFGAGEMIGSAPLMLVPGGQTTALGRIGAQALTGLGSGALRGWGQSESEDAGGALRDAAIEGGVDAALSAGLGGTAEGGAGLLRRLGPLARRITPHAVQSRLEASGIWGSRAMRAADELPGGQEGLAANLRRLGIGHGVGDGRGRAGALPIPTRSLDDAEHVRAMAGQRMGGVISRMDEAAQMGGPREARQGMVDLGRVADEMEGVARDLERLPIGGRQAGQSLREQVVSPLREAGAVDFRTAHAQRQHLDRMISSWAQDPNLATIAGRLQTARRAISRTMDEAAESVDPSLRSTWREANRDYATGAFVDEYGRGAERLSVGGGIGTQVGAGLQTALQGVPGGGAIQMMAGREVAQQQRMLSPGLRTVALEGLADSLRALGPHAQRWAAQLEAAGQRGPTALAALHYALQRRDPEYRAAVETTRQTEEE
jgi:hypothetical protein